MTAQRIAAEMPVEFVLTPWDDAAAAHLAQLATPLDWYRGEIESRRCALWAVYLDGGRVASVVWRRDVEYYGSCFVVVAAVGDHRRFDLTAIVLPEIERRARAMRCKAVRFHTERRGLAAKGALQGYRAAEFVMRKRLDHVA